MNYERRYLIQKKRADDLQKKVGELEEELDFLQKQNILLADKITAYKFSFSTIDKMKTEYQKGIEDVQLIKEQYKKVISEVNKTKSEYSRGFKKLLKAMKSAKKRKV